MRRLTATSLLAIGLPIGVIFIIGATIIGRQVALASLNRRLQHNIGFNLMPKGTEDPRKDAHGTRVRRMLYDKLLTIDVRKLGPPDIAVCAEFGPHYFAIQWIEAAPTPNGIRLQTKDGRMLYETKMGADKQKENESLAVNGMVFDADFKIGEGTELDKLVRASPPDVVAGLTKDGRLVSNLVPVLVAPSESVSK